MATAIAERGFLQIAQEHVTSGRPLPFLAQSVAIETVSDRKVITADALLVGRGATHKGRAVNGKWGPHM